MKKVLFYFMLVVTTILLIPFIISVITTNVYLKLVWFITNKPAVFVRNAAPLPKWYKWFANHVIDILKLLPNED